MKNKKKLFGALALLLVVVLSIGYAALSTSLNVTGTAKVSATGWDVHFENIKVIGGSVTATTAPTISSSGTSITYSLKLTEPGQYYGFTVDVVNDGTLDACVTDIDYTGLTSEQELYLNYTVGGSNNKPDDVGNIWAPGQTVNYEVLLEYDDYADPEELPTTDQTLNLTLTMVFAQQCEDD